MTCKSEIFLLIYWKLHRSPFHHLSLFMWNFNFSNAFSVYQFLCHLQKFFIKFYWKFEVESFPRKSLIEREIYSKSLESLSRLQIGYEAIQILLVLQQNTKKGQIFIPTNKNCNISVWHQQIYSANAFSILVIGT